MIKHLLIVGMNDTHKILTEAPPAYGGFKTII
jgi:hypothetical protein